MSSTSLVIIALLSLTACIFGVFGARLWLDERRRAIRVTENPFGVLPLPPLYCNCAAFKDACDCNSLERAARSVGA